MSAKFQHIGRDTVITLDYVCQDPTSESLLDQAKALLSLYDIDINSCQVDEHMVCVPNRHLHPLFIFVTYPGYCKEPPCACDAFDYRATLVEAIDENHLREMLKSNYQITDTLFAPKGCPEGPHPYDDYITGGTSFNNEYITKAIEDDDNYDTMMNIPVTHIMDFFGDYYNHHDLLAELADDDVSGVQIPFVHYFRDCLHFVNNGKYTKPKGMLNGVKMCKCDQDHYEHSVYKFLMN